MRVFYKIEEVETPVTRGSAVTLGCFDGVHLGHRAIIGRVLERREALGGAAGLITFDPPPALAFDPSSACLQITTTEEKLEILEELGLDWVLVIPFDKDFMLMSAEAFVGDVFVGRIGAGAVVVGHDVGFGHKRRGDADFLTAEGARLGFDVEVMEPVLVGSKLVSSTAIRGLISTADIGGAERLLGRAVSLRGPVVHDQHLGRTIGIPTANLEVHPHKLLVPDGVYAVRAIVGGLRLPAVMSIGVRPTVSNDGRQAVEVHILDFDEDIYGSVISVELVELIRWELKFASLDALVSQIMQDISAARRILNSG